MKKITEVNRELQPKPEEGPDVYGIMDNLYMFILLGYGVGLIMITKGFFYVEDFYRSVGLQSTDYVWSALWVMAGVVISFSLYGAMKFLCRGFIKRNVTWEKQHLNKEGDRQYRVENQVYGVVYYLMSSIFFWSLLYVYEPECLPKGLGGELDLWSFTSNWPRLPHIVTRAYFMTSIGHHIERTVQYVLYKRESKSFWTMILHHVLTVALMMVSYSIRAFMFGYSVLITHEISDMFMYLTRLVRELKQAKTLLPICYVCLLFVWIYTRSYVFTAEVLYPLVTHVVFEFDVVRYMFYICVAGLLILGILNTYWTLLVLKMGFSKFFKKENVVFKFDVDTKKEI